MKPEELNRRMAELDEWKPHWLKKAGRFVGDDLERKPPDYCSDLALAVDLAAKLGFNTKIYVDGNIVEASVWKGGVGLPPTSAYPQDHTSPSAAAAYALCSAIDKAEGK